MICINDIKSKNRRQIIIIPEIINLIGSYSDVFIIGIRGEYVSFSNIGGFDMNSVFSQTCFMYFKRKKSK
jgi:hypothetical protein